jgi:hypothetical protein
LNSYQNLIKSLSGQQAVYSSYKLVEVLVGATALLAILCVVCLVGVVYVTEGPQAGFEEVLRQTILDRMDFNPEPAERKGYLIGLFFLPVIMMLLLLNGSWERGLTRSASILAPGLLFTFCVLLLGSVWLSSSSDVFSLRGVGNISFYRSLFISEILMTPLPVFLLVIGTFIAGVLLPQFNEIQYKIVRILAVTLITFLSVMCVLDDNDLMAVSVHFQAIVEPILQVMNGKTLLIDLPSQYGLYPHLVEPFFHVVGLSVTSLSAFFSLLIFITFALMFVSITRMTKSPIVSLMGLMAITSCCYFFGKYTMLIKNPPVDPYFQYWPIRTLFPALLLYLITGFSQSTSYARYVVGHVLMALGCLWNIDSGLPAWGAWIAFHMYREVRLSAAFRHLLVGMIVLATTVALCVLFFYFRSGQWPSVSGIVEYQRIFFFFGFYMLPMPMLHPWNVVVLVYSVSMSWAIYHWLRRGSEESEIAPVVFSLVILGGGLFSYYAGRSHDFVFGNVIYPAILLGVIFLDRMIALYRKQAGNEHATNRVGVLSGAAAVLVSSFLIIYSSSMLAKLPVLADATMKRLALLSSKEYQRTTEVKELSQRVVGDKGSVIILSSHTTFWHLVTHTSSPVQDSFIGILYKADVDRLIEEIKNSDTHGVLLDVYLSKNKSAGELNARLQINRAMISGGYELVDQTPDKTFQYWVRKGEVGLKLL